MQIDIVDCALLSIESSCELVFPFQLLEETLIDVFTEWFQLLCNCTELVSRYVTEDRMFLLKLPANGLLTSPEFFGYRGQSCIDESEEL